MEKKTKVSIYGEEKELLEHKTPLIQNKNTKSDSKLDGGNLIPPEAINSALDIVKGFAIGVSSAYLYDKIKERRNPFRNGKLIVDITEIQYEEGKIKRFFRKIIKKI